MRFAIDYISTFVLFVGLLFITLLKNSFVKSSISPSFTFSRLTDLKQKNWRSNLASYPHQLHVAALICLMIAFVDPHLLFPKPAANQKKDASSHSDPTEGIAIYLLLDQSGSMAQSVETRDDKGTKKKSKIDLLKTVTKQFILNHPSDLIGIVSFARVARVVVPLTLDQDTLLKKLGEIQITKSADEDGTAIGYAIYKTANLISATVQFASIGQLQGNVPYKIKSAVMIVVTDGFQDPSRLDQGNRLRTLELDDAAAFAKGKNIRLYVINIDPALSSAEYAPQRRQLQKITALTGGRFYLVSDAQSLQDIYSDIDHLEKGSIQQEIREASLDGLQNYKRLSFYPFFVSIGMIFLFTSLLLESTVLRRIP